MITAALTIYTTSWCGYCLRLKTALTANRIAYDEVDIEHNRAAAEFVGSVNAATELFPR
ncbi:glutaredoxin-like protein [Mycobacterium tuberculosis TKK-01-0046]|nr:glutaredoxin-like protein [Mycobacterium tuberculosis TKK-01-0039]KBZ35387.1 glutaredoxin-like protein [Mycobacterium tuberculosis TKK-01-0046]KCL78945.1 glutaredoxin-like protein [Mycobacterium tuberculosis TB_RSA175]KCL86711.1 glutaredoxin-like protein [Mycobacterium tuberculosis TB_RSA176]